MTDDDMTDWAITGCDGTLTAGRKGVAYDWRAVLASVEAANLDHDLASLSLEFVES